MTVLTKQRPFLKALNAALWALQILTAAAFLATGSAALSGQPMAVETFDKIGIGQWFRYVTGALEVASAILLLIPRLTAVGAALLFCTMVGATLTHLVIGGSPVPALLLGCSTAIILFGRLGTVQGGEKPAHTRTIPAARREIVPSPPHAQ